LQLTLPRLDIEPKAFAVSAGGHQPSQVRTQDRGVPCRQSSQNVRMGVPEGILKSRRDQGD
jgi:hypothetical protein